MATVTAESAAVVAAMATMANVNNGDSCDEGRRQQQRWSQ
jgi:hypothetical protein